MVSKEKQIIVVDPELWVKRNLNFIEKQSRWHIFTTIYWGIYVLILGSLLVFYSSISINLIYLFGTSLIIFSIMLIIYGFSVALHSKLMKKYA
ncbi:MAG: hypothetical protein ACP5RT_01185 [Candidatus Micrarchaeia archaeon]